MILNKIMKRNIFKKMIRNYLCTQLKKKRKETYEYRFQMAKKYHYIFNNENDFNEILKYLNDYSTYIMYLNDKNIIYFVYTNTTQQQIKHNILQKIK